MTDQQAAKIRRMEREVTRLQRMNLHYLWGGGRNFTTGRMTEPKADSGYTDCSGFFQKLCEIGAVHLDNYVGSTFSLAGEGLEGESPLFTAFIKNVPADDAHIIVRFRRRPLRFKAATRVRDKLFGAYRWAQCGGRDNPDPDGGPHWFRPTKSRISEFPIRRQFKGLIKDGK